MDFKQKLETVLDAFVDGSILDLSTKGFVAPSLQLDHANFSVYGIKIGAYEIKPIQGSSAEILTKEHPDQAQWTHKIVLHKTEEKGEEYIDVYRVLKFDNSPDQLILWDLEEVDILAVEDSAMPLVIYAMPDNAPFPDTTTPRYITKNFNVDNTAIDAAPGGYDSTIDNVEMDVRSMLREPVTQDHFDEFRKIEAWAESHDAVNLIMMCEYNEW